MCEPCRSRIILRTACGASQVIGADCDHAKRVGYVIPMLPPMEAGAIGFGSQTIPEAMVDVMVREFTWRGDFEEGMPVLHEVVRKPKSEIRLYVNDKAVAPSVEGPRIPSAEDLLKYLSNVQIERLRGKRA